MPRLPGISQRDAVRVFERLGYRIARQSGHIVMTNGTRHLVIPRHNPINAMTMGGIAKDAGLTPDSPTVRLRKRRQATFCKQPRPAAVEQAGV